ncbi:hypothetical protein BVRB_8g194210 [Beta vulgaris subsp. vulgaris]|nr:hypothetical protein BVRB_8g194210 [Beta vulgaris subsp. vulgaris]
MSTQAHLTTTIQPHNIGCERKRKQRTARRHPTITI